MADPKSSEPAEPMRLADFIRQHMPLIVDEWLVFARTRTPASENMSTSSLRDHVEEILVSIADELGTFETGAEQTLKSGGHQPKQERTKQTAAEIHAALRLNDGFDMDQMISEYRALRASVIRLWSNDKRIFTAQDLDDLIRFNDAIDRAVAESISQFMEIVERSRNLFLGILGHDLRNPLGAVSMCAEAMIISGKLDAKQQRLATQIGNCTFRALRISEDLLDLTRIQFGSELPITKREMNLAALSEKVIDEIRLLYPSRTVDINVRGSMEVEWDSSRIGQVLSNLVGNAMTHGSRKTPVSVCLRGNVDQVILTVQSEGKTIPPDAIKEIFNLFARGDKDSAENSTTLHLGLGLYISKQIVEAHDGILEVTSTAENGTSFIATLPRR